MSTSGRKMKLSKISFGSILSLFPAENRIVRRSSAKNCSAVSKRLWNSLRDVFVMLIASQKENSQSMGGRFYENIRNFGIVSSPKYCSHKEFE